MSYTYRERERDRDWDEPVTIKRYVVPSEDDRDRERDFFYRREDPYTGERELTIRRTTDRDDSAMLSRYDREVDYDSRGGYDYRSERDYYERESTIPDRHRPRHIHHTTAPIVIRESQPVIIQEARAPVYVHPRESDYEIVQRPESDREPAYYYHRRVREYDDDRRLRRELSPGDSVSQATRRREDQGYSSDDSMVYIRKETREYDDHHRRHMAEGALVGVGAAELLRSRRKKEGDEVASGMGRVGRDVGAGALGAIAVNAASRARDYYRSKSRHRSHSFDDDRSSRSHHRPSHHSHSHSRRSRSRSHSHSRARTFAEIGLGAAAIAGAVALARNKSGKDKDKDKDRRSRSRHRRSASVRSRSTVDDKRSESQRRKHMAGAGLAGAAVAGLVEKARSRSRSRRRKHSRSHSRLRKALPVVAAGLGTAAATGLYEKHKDKKDEDESRNRGRRRSRSRSRSRAASEMYPDPSRDSAGLIEYGEHPMPGRIPAADYYGRPSSQRGYYSDAEDPVARDAAGYGRHRSRSRSMSRGGRHRSSSSDSDGHRRRRKSRSRHRSKSRDIAEAALAATGVGYAAHKYSQHKDRKKEGDRSRYDDRREPYEDSYASEPPYAPSPVQASIENQYYPNTPHFPPPPGSAPRPAGAAPAYNPADYPPPPGAVPPQGYGYASPPVPEPYAPRPRRADENVSAPWNPDNAQSRTHDGLNPDYVPRRPRPRRYRSHSQPPQPKSVAFDLRQPMDPGYETDDSDSTIQSFSSHRRRHNRSRPYIPRRNSSADSYYRTESRRTRPETPRPRPPPPAPNAPPHHLRPHQLEKQKTPEAGSDSDATIDLPDRFDSQGRLLPQRGDDSLADQFEDLLKGVNRIFA